MSDNVITGEDCQLRYYIGGVDIRDTYGIRIEKSSGLLSRPKMKQPQKADWPDCHGEVVDLAQKRVEARTITLKGWMPASSKVDFIEKWAQFLSLFDTGKTCRLMLIFHTTRPLVYEVYLEDQLDMEKRWSESEMVGTFTLKLKEPEPVKRVIMAIVKAENQQTRQVSVRMTSDNPVSISWGDGTYDEDLYGSIDITHDYPEVETDTTYYAIIHGVIEEIEDFVTTGIVIWQRI